MSEPTARQNEAPARQSESAARQTEPAAGQSESSRWQDKPAARDSQSAAPQLVPDSAEQIDEAMDFAIQTARVAADNKSLDVAVLDLRGLSSLADFFVIGTGTSNRQMHAVLDHIRKLARAQGRRPYNIADSSSARWILADYIDVIIHLFDAEHRDYYDLDNLWGDAPRVEWQPEPTDPDG